MCFKMQRWNPEKNVLGMMYIQISDWEIGFFQELAITS